MKNNLFTQLDGSGLRIAVIAARFNQDLTDALLEDCLMALEACQITRDFILVERVPGSFELPVTASIMAERGNVDVVICLGVLIKGDTRHDQYIAEAVAEGLTTVSMTTRCPVIFGVLTTENREQAMERSLGGHKKGWEAGMSAVEMALVVKRQME